VQAWTDGPHPCHCAALPGDRGAAEDAGPRQTPSAVPHARSNRAAGEAVGDCVHDRRGVDERQINGEVSSGPGRIASTRSSTAGERGPEGESLLVVTVGPGTSAAALVPMSRRGRRRGCGAPPPSVLQSGADSPSSSFRWPGDDQGNTFGGTAAHRYERAPASPRVLTATLWRRAPRAAPWPPNWRSRTRPAEILGVVSGYRWLLQSGHSELTEGANRPGAPGRPNLVRHCCGASSRRWKHLRRDERELRRHRCCASAVRVTASICAGPTSTVQ
jgi:hypothetical protein